MNEKARCGIASYAAPLREERLRGSLLTLIGLDLIAFAGAGALALCAPDAFDVAASSANGSVLAWGMPANAWALPDLPALAHAETAR